MRTYIDKLRENHAQFMAYQNLPRVEVAIETMSLIPIALLYVNELESRIKELEAENAELRHELKAASKRC